MIRSMTAFAVIERATPWGSLALELRAVNHRYLEVSMRTPEEFRALEPALRERIGQRVQRGKLDFTLRFRARSGHGDVQLNTALLDRLSHLAIECRQRFPGMSVEFAELLKIPGVLEYAEIDMAELHATALELLGDLLDEFTRSREREGEKLAALMEERLAAMVAVLANVRTWVPEIRKVLRQRLEARLSELAQPLDSGRVEQELVLSLQKIDVDEELDRLGVHIGEARRVLGLREAVGRRLDFLMQEFNREANTLGSKSVDTRTTQASVELKVLIEQLREQVQNVE